MARLYRTQVLLEPEQHAKLAEIAKREGRSISDLVRGMLQAEIERRRHEQDSDRQVRLAGLERIRQHREAILKERNGEPLDLNAVEIIDQIREERDAENWAILTNSGD